MLISKERNTKKVTPKQNGVSWRNTYVKISMDSGVSASIIHKSYVSKSAFITRRTYANKWSIMAGSISTSHEAEITLKMPKLNVTAHIYATFHVTTKTNNYDIIFGRDLILELGIQLDFKNNSVAW